MSDLEKNKSFLARSSLTSFLPPGLRPANYLTIFLVVVFGIAFVPRGARRAIETNNNDVKDWLPASYKESAELEWFQKHFIGEQFALVSWEGCTLGNTRKLELLAHKLVPSDSGVKSKRTELFKHVTTGPEIIEKLIQPPLGLSYQEAIRRMEGALVGPLPEGAEDDAARTTCLVVTLSAKGQQDPRHKHMAINAIKEAASECAIAEDELRLGGPPVDNVAIDEEGKRTLFRLAGLSGIVGLTLSYLCFRSLKLMFMVFTVGVISAGASLAMVRYFGMFEVFALGYENPRLGTVDAILMSMPSLVYVLGLSGAIHIINYYRDARREDGINGAAEAALGHGWIPCTLAALTTAVGLGSLYISDITPIKKFGVFSAIGVIGTLGLLFTLLPVFLHRLPPAEESNGSSKERPIFSAFMHYVAGFIIRRNGWVCVASIAVMLAFAYGLTRIETRIQLLKLFDENARIIHDYAWLEEHLGNLVPMEVVLRVEPSHIRQGGTDPEADGQNYRLNMFEQMELVQRVQHKIESLEHVGRALSAVSFGPDLDVKKSGPLGPLVDPRNVVNIQLEKHREELLAEDYLREEVVSDTGDAQNEAETSAVRSLWRISSRVCALEDVDYGVFVDEIYRVVEPVLEAYRQRDAVLQKLHAEGKRLRMSNIALLYEEQADAAEADQNDSARLLYKLLRQAGARVQSINLATLPVEDSTQQVTDRIQAFLAKQDCVVVFPISGSIKLAALLAGNVLRHDVPDIARLVDERKESRGAGTANLSAVYTGVVPLVYKTQRQLLGSLEQSIVLACGLIAIVMMLVLRSIPAGLVSMIPNVFPIALVFGAMGWLGIKVDIGIMMTASVALGVAVDDTVHFLTWYREGMSRGLDRKAATMQAYERCASAMFQTTIIGGLGLSVFAFSTFTPTQQFGVLMVTLLSAALIGDLVLLPALLSGPIGKFFGGQMRRDSKTPPEGPSDDAAGKKSPGRTKIRQDAPHRSMKSGLSAMVARLFGRVRILATTRRRLRPPPRLVP